MNVIKIQCAESCLISLWIHQCVSVRWRQSNVLISGLALAACRLTEPRSAWPQAKKSPCQISLSTASGNQRTKTHERKHTQAHTFFFSLHAHTSLLMNTPRHTIMLCWPCAITLIKVSFQSQGDGHPLLPLTSLSLSHKQTHTAAPPKHLAPNDLTRTHLNQW